MSLTPERAKEIASLRKQVGKPAVAMNDIKSLLKQHGPMGLTTMAAITGRAYDTLQQAARRLLVRKEIHVTQVYIDGNVRRRIFMYGPDPDPNRDLKTYEFRTKRAEKQVEQALATAKQNAGNPWAALMS